MASSHLCPNRKQKHLGHFSTKIEAAFAYDTALRALNLKGWQNRVDDLLDDTTRQRIEQAVRQRLNLTNNPQVASGRA